MFYKTNNIEDFLLGNVKKLSKFNHSDCIFILYFSKSLHFQN